MVKKVKLLIRNIELLRHVPLTERSGERRRLSFAKIIRLINFLLATPRVDVKVRQIHIVQNFLVNWIKTCLVLAYRL